jgi:hypothetical protein
MARRRSDTRLSVPSYGRLRAIFAAGAAAVFCLTGILWVCSHAGLGGIECATYRAGPEMISRELRVLLVGGGRLYVHLETTEITVSAPDPPSPKRVRWRWTSSRRNLTAVDYKLRLGILAAGWSNTITPRRGGTWVCEIMIPLWVMAGCTVLVAILPTKRLAWTYIRRRRSANGCCMNCGYQLIESQLRCPECGVTRRQ